MDCLTKSTSFSPEPGLPRRRAFGQAFGRAVGLALGLCSVLVGCAGFGGTPPTPGDDVATVEAKFGKPTDVYPVGPERMLEYATGPAGQRTWMARIGADGRLVSFEQVLTGPKFATLKIGAATKNEVLRTIGRPAERTALTRIDREVWSYRYKENDVWDSVMSVQFDHDGVVREMVNGPDPLMEEHGGRRR